MTMTALNILLVLCFVLQLWAFWQLSKMWKILVAVINVAAYNSIFLSDHFEDYTVLDDIRKNA